MGIMRLNYLWTFIAKLFHKILPLGSILAIRKPRLYKEMKCIMKCNKKENWNHLFECEDFIKKVLQNILGVTAKSEKFQKFQQLALEVKVETLLTTKLQKDFKISLTEAQTFMANILIRFILAFKELIWKPRCEQVILWEKRRGISRTDKITSESKGKDNSNQPSESKVSLLGKEINGYLCKEIQM
ncbi:hypothetical protein GLOIN_2v1790055 [Rhizophagus irregularis DAOM 181602=DAOM 197198]|nr:hypothetical protein GLOIN_2v1790055 [Rhizophagus irregularis DAOM 181602=DAOM 197198]